MNAAWRSKCLYTFVFMLIQLFGGLLIGVGLYAFYDKWQATGSVRVENVYDVVLNISLVMVIAGGVVFIVSFAGCVGALRENTCLLKFVGIFLTYDMFNPLETMDYPILLCLFAVFVVPAGIFPARDGCRHNRIRLSAHAAVTPGGIFYG